MEQSTQQEPPAPPSRKRPWGFLAFYTFITGYGAVAIFGSMLVSLYGTPKPEDMDAMWCKGELTTLHAELENQAQQELQALNPSERTGERWKRWQVKWSERLKRASGACQQDPEMITGFAILNELSTDYGGILQELGGARDHLRNHLTQLISNFKT